MNDAPIWTAIATAMTAAAFMFFVLWWTERSYARALSDRARHLAGRCRALDRDLAVARDRLAAGGSTRAARQREAERIARDEKTKLLKEGR